MIWRALRLLRSHSASGNIEDNFNQNVHVTKVNEIQLRNVTIVAEDITM